MIEVKLIKPRAGALEKEAWELVARQAKEAWERQIGEQLRDVQCPVHHVQPSVRLEPVDLSRRPTAVAYEVHDPCCQKLIDEVKSVLGDKIALSYK